MIDQQMFDAASSEAFAAVRHYLDDVSLDGANDEPRSMLFTGGDNELFRAGDFARFIGGSPQQFNESLPAGFGSWLMRLALGDDQYKLIIAMNSPQIRTWAQPCDAANPLREVTMVSRCLYHEVGHIKLHDRLVKPSAVPALGTQEYALADASTPEEEEQAWVFAFMVLGIIVGDYARDCRKGGIDDTPFKCI